MESQHPIFAVPWKREPAELRRPQASSSSAAQGWETASYTHRQITPNNPDPPFLRGTEFPLNIWFPQNKDALGSWRGSIFCANIWKICQ